nr:hypothetical protein [Methanobacterium formicicum]
MEKFGREYLKTILEINKHFEGYVDSYFGPPELKKTSRRFFSPEYCCFNGGSGSFRRFDTRGR